MLMWAPSHELKQKSLESNSSTRSAPHDNGDNKHKTKKNSGIASIRETSLSFNPMN